MGGRCTMRAAAPCPSAVPQKHSCPWPWETVGRRLGKGSTRVGSQPKLIEALWPWSIVTPLATVVSSKDSRAPNGRWVDYPVAEMVQIHLHSLWSTCWITLAGPQGPRTVDGWGFIAHRLNKVPSYPLTLSSLHVINFPMRASSAFNLVQVRESYHRWQRSSMKLNTRSSWGKVMARRAQSQM